VNNIVTTVISLSEIKNRGNGTNAGSVHCQKGQGGMVGFIVPTTGITSGGKRLKKNKTIKKIKKPKKTLKKVKIMNKKLGTKNKIKYSKKLK